MSIRRARVAEEADYWYLDKLNDRRLGFRPKADEMTVTFSQAADDDVLSRLVQAAPVRSVSRGANPRLGFAAIHVRPAADVTALQSLPEVANALPVMVDPEGLSRYFLPDELTVQFREDMDSARAEEIIRGLGSEVLVRQRTPGYYTVAVPEGAGLFSTIRRFAALLEVMFAEPSEAGFEDLLAYTPDDPDFPLLWGMHNTGQDVNGTSGTVGIDIKAPDAWDMGLGDPRIVIAVIDSGADLDHPDLSRNILPRNNEDWDFADPEDRVPDDALSHGTHVAGTAAAVDNTVGVIGVAPRCRIMPLRIDGRAGRIQDRVDAINYVTQRAATMPTLRFVVNCSWSTSGDIAAIRSAITNAVSRNVLVVFAAGNDKANTDVTPKYPGVYPQVVSVAAIDQDGVKPDFSNYGSTIDVSAPGVNIYSSVPDNRHGFKNGTSMATPHVAGLGGLVWSAAPGLTNLQVRLIIEDSCDDLDALNPGLVGQLGSGLINAYRAVWLAQFVAGYVPSFPALS